MLKQKKLFLALVAWAFLPSYCFSDVPLIPGVSNNAAAHGLSWSMGTVVPQNSGITVTGILYEYTVNKESEDDLTVTIRNQDTQYGIDPEITNRYIFSHTDDWSGKDEETIRKILNGMRLSGLRFGDGEIATEGDGFVTDPEVRYLYNFDPCFDPLYDPTCPGYDEASLQWALQYIGNFDDTVEDPYYTKEVQDVLDQEAEPVETIDNEEEPEEETDKKMNELASDAGLSEYSKINNDLFTSLTRINIIESYYGIDIPGLDYKDNAFYETSEMSDNATAMRSLAQDNVHREMVRSQYED